MATRTKIRLTAFLLLVLTAGAVFLDFPNVFERINIPIPNFVRNIPFRLGLDLQGGTHLIYEADVSQIPSADHASAVEGVRDVIERRVNAFGVAEPVIQTTRSGEKWRVIAELAGVHDVSQAITMIGETPQLEFREPNLNPQVELTEEQQVELDTINADATKLAQDILNQLQQGENFEELAAQHSQDSANAAAGGDLGYATRGQFAPAFEKVCFDELKNGQISDELVETQFGLHIIKREDQVGEGVAASVRCSHILITTVQPTDIVEANNWLYTGLTGKQLERAQVTFSGTSQEPQVSLEFDSEGARLFEEITERNIGRQVAIFLDNEPISTPTVQNVISQGQAVITGNFDIAEARLLAQRLNAGALPVPIELISQQTVGATLGNLSVEKSLRAGIIGLMVVGLFMLLYYRLPGLLAVISLIIYGLLVLLVFKLVGVTLTLAGIAGFILSLGMAVDANVLIFERLKEEIRAGRQLETAVINGFKRAWPSIYDGNVSTLLTCLILIGFSTSLIKGFAITLAIGILVSMFSAMVITRVLLDLVVRMKMAKGSWLYGIKKPKTQQP